MIDNIRYHFNTSTNFWIEFPEMKLIEPFTTLYKADKISRKHSASSKIMWGIHLAYCPTSSFYKIPGKLDLIASDFYKKPLHDWESETNLALVERYKEVVLNEVEFEMEEWFEMMKMRRIALMIWYKEAILDNDYEKVAELDKILSTTNKMFEDYKKIKATLDLVVVKKNNKELSASDSGDI